MNNSISKNKQRKRRRYERLLQAHREEKFVEKSRVKQTQQKAREDYRWYLDSNEWKERRNKYWKDNGAFCKACGSVDNLQVHHMHYGHIGREKDKHIIGLCHLCHETFHRLHHLRVNMTVETLVFVGAVKTGKLNLLETSVSANCVVIE